MRTIVCGHRGALSPRIHVARSDEPRQMDRLKFSAAVSDRIDHQKATPETRLSVNDPSSASILDRTSNHGGKDGASPVVKPIYNGNGKCRRFGDRHTRLMLIDFDSTGEIGDSS